ncbi:MAG: type II toxin-antitoxin system prevent-host-death family antitoxin [Sulfuricella sp.]|nr:type II toxin-antitoxin system prevent-host-death family antitoxin [Sulfuricella sp.]
MDTFTIRDLRERTGDLVRDAEQGKLSLVTKHGQPVFLAVPFDEALLRGGVKISMAIKLFDDEVLTAREAAKVAGMPLGEFMAACSAQGVPIVRYSADELARELAVFDDVHSR